MAVFTYSRGVATATAFAAHGTPPVAGGEDNMIIDLVHLIVGPVLGFRPCRGVSPLEVDELAKPSLVSRNYSRFETTRSVHTTPTH
jgi:hypothetical protein